MFYDYQIGFWHVDIIEWYSSLSFTLGTKNMIFIGAILILFGVIIVLLGDKEIPAKDGIILQLFSWPQRRPKWIKWLMGSGLIYAGLTILFYA